MDSCSWSVIVGFKKFYSLASYRVLHMFLKSVRMLGVDFGKACMHVCMYVGMHVHYGFIM